MPASVIVIKTNYNPTIKERETKVKQSGNPKFLNKKAEAPLTHSEVRPIRVRVKVDMLGPERW